MTENNEDDRPMLTSDGRPIVDSGLIQLKFADGQTIPYELFEMLEMLDA